MRYTFHIIILLFCLTTLQGQTIKDVILTIPDDVIVGLSIEQKKQLGADPATDSVTFDNVFEGEIKRLAISKDYVNIQTSEVGTTQIKILPLVNDTKILCVVKTVCADACDSRIAFYTTTWKPLPEQDILPKRTFDWFLKKDIDRKSDDFKEAIKAVDMNPMIFNLSPNDYSLNVESDIEEYLEGEDYDSLKPFLQEKPKSFVWDKISFKENN